MGTGAQEGHLAELTCWKDIAGYIGKGVRTVQRWEQRYGLPVQRPLGTINKSSVMAHRCDLDVWLQQRWSDRAGRKDGSALTSGQDPLANSLGSRIRTSRELRLANHALMQDISVLVKAMVQNCQQLTLKRLEHQLRPDQGLPDFARIDRPSGGFTSGSPN